jgi:hypothetical protein
MDPVKSAAKMVTKNPSLVVRIKPDGEIEISSKAAMPAIGSNQNELDASVGNEVWDAIAAIKDAGNHGAH